MATRALPFLLGRLNTSSSHGLVCSVVTTIRYDATPVADGWRTLANSQMTNRTKANLLGCPLLLLVAVLRVSGQEWVLHVNRTAEQPTLSSDASWAGATVV